MVWTISRNNLIFGKTSSSLNNLTFNSPQKIEFDLQKVNSQCKTYTKWDFHRSSDMFERYVRFKRISVDRDKEKERGISCLTLPVRKGAPFVGRSRSLTSRGIAARPQRCSRIYRIMKTLIASKQDDTTIRSRGWAERKSYLAPGTTSPRTFT